MRFEKLFRVLVLGGAAMGASAGCGSNTPQQKPNENKMAGVDGGMSGQAPGPGMGTPAAPQPRTGGGATGW
jgi:hypothetical protein